VASILIDALGVDSPGGRRHLEGFLPALAEHAGGHRFRFLVRQSASSALSAFAGRGPVEPWPIRDGISRGVLTRLLCDLIYVPLHARRRRFDLVVTLANFGPVWTPTPHVVFQQNAMHFSEEFLGRLGGRELLEWRLRALLSVAEMRFATVVVTPTDAMGELIKTAHPSLASRRFVTLLHATDLSRFRAPVERPAKRRFVFLYPTKIQPYKGVEILLEAVRRLAAIRDDFDVQLTAEGRGWPRDIQQEIDRGRGHSWFDRVQFVGARPADRMPDAYHAADALVYPTLCESFGFPLLEAMACGLPIVAADLDVNRELCAGSARYYDAKSSASCSDAMRSVLENASLRDELRGAGRARIDGRDWTWGRYAQRFVELCESVIGERNGRS
jgi:glycosyltransferase involved in cell wall biosynthesis